MERETKHVTVIFDVYEGIIEPNELINNVLCAMINSYSVAIAGIKLDQVKGYTIYNTNKVLDAYCMAECGHSDYDSCIARNIDGSSRCDIYKSLKKALGDKD